VLGLLVNMTPLLEHMAPMQPCPSTLRDEAEADDLGGKVWDRQAGTRVHKFTDSRQINLIIFSDLFMTLPSLLVIRWGRAMTMTRFAAR
jgi:hypothetical protein